MKNQSYKYENIQIGNFLFSIGYYLGKLNYRGPTLFNLNQQTPNDYTIGDLLGQLAGKFFIIEFKSSKSNLRNDLKKPQRRELVNEILKNQPSYKELSLNGHIACFPIFINQELEFNIIPYLGIVNEDFVSYEMKSCKEFILSFSQEKPIGVSFNDIKKYIELLRKCASEVGSNNSVGGLSGILMNFDKETIRYLLFDDWNFLQQKISIEKEIKQTTLRKISKEHDNGYGMGM